MGKHHTPKEVIHAWCHYCVRSRSDVEVEACGGSEISATGNMCPFYNYRMGKRPSMKAFRQFCLDCMGGNHSFVRECNNEDCPMHCYRFGKNPSRKGSSREQMASIRLSRSTLSTAKLFQDRFSVAKVGQV